MTARPGESITTDGRTDGDASTSSIAARLAIGVVKGYQYVSAGRPSPCRHVPSCSTYAIEAVETHGAFKGTGLAVRRLGRCHPWGTQGYDPVPGRGEEPSMQERA